MYLLICEPSAAERVEADLLAEAKVQLGAVIHVRTATQVLRDSLPAWHDGSIRLVYFDAWLPTLVEALDRQRSVPPAVEPSPADLGQFTEPL
jgi:hypothetical protein